MVDPKTLEELNEKLFDCIESSLKNGNTFVYDGSSDPINGSMDLCFKGYLNDNKSYDMELHVTIDVVQEELPEEEIDYVKDECDGDDNDE